MVSNDMTGILLGPVAGYPLGRDDVAGNMSPPFLLGLALVPDPAEMLHRAAGFGVLRPAAENGVGWFWMTWKGDDLHAAASVKG